MFIWLYNCIVGLPAHSDIETQSTSNQTPPQSAPSSQDPSFQSPNQTHTDSKSTYPKKKVVHAKISFFEYHSLWKNLGTTPSGGSNGRMNQGLSLLEKIFDDTRTGAGVSVGARVGNFQLYSILQK